MRDYDEVARNLPVFCVSARAYQKLAGRLKKDAVQVDGFLSQDDTEIPQLQEYTKKLTESVRLNTSRDLLNQLNQLLNSMKLWAFHGTRSAMSNKTQEIDELFLHSLLTSLEKVGIDFLSIFAISYINILFQDLQKALNNFLSSLRNILSKQLYSTLDRLIPAASESAVAIAK